VPPINEKQQDLHGLELASQLDPIGIKNVRQMLLLLKTWGCQWVIQTNTPGIPKDGTSPDFLKVLLLMIASLLSRLRGLLHFHPQAQRAHISPNLANVFQTLSLCSRFTCIFPSERQFTMGRPNRILLFMIHNRFVNGFVFAVIHFRSPLNDKYGDRREFFPSPKTTSPDKKTLRELHALAESRLPPFLDQTNVQERTK